MIEIDKWVGRLGNNIKQLRNVIDIAIAYKHNIIISALSGGAGTPFEHGIDMIKFFDLSIIVSYFNKYTNTEKIIDKDENSRHGANFIHIEHTARFPKEVFTQNVKERNQLLKKAFLIKDIQKLPENDLVIHIRSGDIFRDAKHFPHWLLVLYCPPPLSYYITEINKYNYETIHIICEDTINPVVNKLLELYKNAIYTKNTLETDIKIILGATNIIASVGTFIPSLLLLSDNIRFKHPDFNDSKYYEGIHPWRNTEKQRHYMLTYNLQKYIETDVSSARYYISHK